MKRTVIASLLALLAAGSVYALNPGESELEYNGWFRYTNQSPKFKVTNPTVSRSTIDRNYLRASHQWTSKLYSKLSLDFLSSSSYADGASVRIKEAYVDMGLPLKDFTFTAGVQKHYFAETYSWDYTHPDKELSDAQGVCASADYGATINGFLPKGFGELQLGVYNGEGYKVTGAKNSVAPELLANLRLTPIAGLQVGASVFSKVKDFSPYANSTGRLSTDRKTWFQPDTANRSKLAFAPMAKVAIGPVSLTGEYIIYNYTRKFSFYKADSASGKVDSTSLTQNTKDYANAGIDLLPVVTLMNQKIDVFGRFSTWQAKEQSGDSMPVNKSKSLMRYGAGFNYHFLRRAGGSKPAVAFQFAWVREQSEKEATPGVKVDPTDTFIAQFRMEWSHLLLP
ncbi:MAG: hypothetical protein NTX53_11120 [candidate division WOR-3 bacterium]|nr:hypothetical protein [candidate division WOR-3 bacterium]